MRVRVHRGPDRAIDGFNPCFTGYGSDARSQLPRNRHPSSCFNPCFTGYGSDAGPVSYLSFKEIPVSILVLLDMALMLRQIRLYRNDRGSFNPCFTGYGSDAPS